MKRSYIVGLIILILAAGIILALGLFKNKVGDPVMPDGPIACTQEALLCPDGSGVGRTGPNCEFAACPAQESYVGLLEQTGDGFRLVMEAPEAVGILETEYVMPLEIQVTNALRDFVGKRVRLFGEFNTGNTLVVERLEELPEDESDPEMARVAIGQTRFINGVNVTLNEVVQDSRCPVDAQCIEGGGITANVSLRSTTDSETRNIASDEVPTPFDAFQISIIEVEPDRVLSSEPEPGSYVLTFRVEKNRAE